ncbi:hypothetical protein BH10CYA1_BH10CYA1_59110 [soil metagenome]
MTHWYHMSLDAHTLAFTKLLAQASTQHLRLTLEPLPVGLIELTEQGIIESIDEWTALKLGFSLDQLQGRSIAMLIEERAPYFLELLKNRQYGTLFHPTLRTKTGKLIVAMVVLERSLQSHKFVCSVIFTSVNMPDECDRPVQIEDENLGESLPQQVAKQNRIQVDFEFALLVTLIALLICFFLAVITMYLQFTW